ncbi:Kar1p NDAI_0F03440 [Naumovozyma dairenensis CBS 421]|uniref:Uncharacterized protein n=1 Tax=Naumovozyma dairenensis (strain ATCC 10597 / BCRC 20456 / CBS 421 / NBRC 0211 / NRRL Y-12639) TaxID=1071378 RepID=G0WD01_NAUDC|nr:hypothetical protein NDAI_0F03440 [Naumovozyma dairenensis CBS 421]CCD25662.1 hypothetical protein NDAI_0F03440 [Naumovozyma dairenensis CBS 421]
MNTGIPNDYLPSTEAQKASNERIRKLNKKFLERKLNLSKSDVGTNNTTLTTVSDGSTSVLPDHGNDNEDDVSIRIKHELHDTNAQLFENRSDETIGSKQRRKNIHLYPGSSLNYLSNEPEIRAVQRRGTEKDDTLRMDDNKGYPEETDEDYEADLGYIPIIQDKYRLHPLKSYGSLSQNHQTEDESHLQRQLFRSAEVRNRTRSRNQSLRKALGDPVPLPYIKKENDSKLEQGMHKRRSSQEEELEEPKTILKKEDIVTTDTLDRKRKHLDMKWQKILANNQPLIENKLKTLSKSSHFTKTVPVDSYVTKKDPNSRHTSRISSVSIKQEDLLNEPISANVYAQETNGYDWNPREGSTSFTSLRSNESVAIEKVQEELKWNSAKLDQILALLHNNNHTKESKKSKTTNLDVKENIKKNMNHTNNKEMTARQFPKEFIYWTICIIILILCNIYVYYYL